MCSATVSRVAISRFQIEKLQRGSEEYLFNFKICIKLGHSNNVFHMSHVPFANRIVSSHFSQDRKLEKKCREIGYS